MRILALDPALHTGVADGVAGYNAAPTLLTWDLTDPAASAPEQVFARAAKRLQQQLALARPDVLAIEQPVPPHRLGSATQWPTTQLLLGLYATYAGMAGAANVRVLPVHIQTWRKVALGSGRLDRARAKHVALRVCQLQGWEAADDDQAEAGCIWLWAHGVTQLGAAARERMPAAADSLMGG